MVALFCLKGLFCALNVISNVVLPQDAVNIGTGCSQFLLIIFIIGVGVVRGLTKECVDAFVSMVYLYDDQTMKIEFNCEDVIRRALEKYGA